MYVSMLSVTLMHPTKAVGRNEMPFGRDIRLVASITLLVPYGKIWGVGKPVRSDAACRQITLALVISSLLLTSLC